MTLQLGIIATVTLVQVVLAWRLLAAHRAVDRVNARLVSQGEALSLLTDTSESGFGAIARELERMTAAQPKPSAKAAPRRATAPARRARGSAGDVSTRKRASDGEVRLRLTLAGHTEADVAADRG